MRVIVVDNDSRDGTVELVRALADVELIEAGRNLGFAAATNRAVDRGRAATSSRSTRTPASTPGRSTRCSS